MALVACAAVLGTGCAREESARLVDFLDELEFDVPLETAAYVSPKLGYSMPTEPRRRRIAAATGRS